MKNIDFIKSKIKKPNLFTFFLMIVAATIITLTSHIYIQNMTTPIIETMQQAMTNSPKGYSFLITACAYGTALIQIGVTLFLYYYAGHLLKIKNNFLKILTLTAIILEMKGALIREPFMNYILNFEFGMENPFLFSTLVQLDKWAPNILLSAFLVYLCPLHSKDVKN